MADNHHFMWHCYRYLALFEDGIAHLLSRDYSLFGKLGPANLKVGHQIVPSLGRSHLYANQCQFSANIRSFRDERLPLHNFPMIEKESFLEDPVQF